MPMPGRSRSGSIGSVVGAGRRSAPAGRLIAVDIDQASLAVTDSFFARERETATRDLLSENVFAPVGSDGEAFRLLVSLADGKLVLDIANDTGEPLIRHILSLSPLRRVIKDYFLICEAYDVAVRDAAPGRVEAIDMGRRGLHDEGARILAERLAGKVLLDHATARRLFTLVAALHRKG